MKRWLVLVLIFVLLLAGYLLFWPVPIEPLAWKPPVNLGLVGPFKVNNRFSKAERIMLTGIDGPEDTAIDREGRIYFSSHQGSIFRMKPGGTPELWCKTGGRPLGIDFDAQGFLIVADGIKGLLRIDPAGREVQVLSTSAEGVPFAFTDDVDTAANGKIYFTDASSKFSVQEWGAAFGSLLAILEHGGDGRLLEYDPATKVTRVLLRGLNFANGVAIAHDQSFVLVNETGTYRIHRYYLAGPKKGKSDIFMDNLPGFPDNITTGGDGRFWVSLFGPRNKAADDVAGNPFMRKLLIRLPSFLHPKAVHHEHIFAVDRDGKVLHDFQNPDGHTSNTSVTEAGDYLYVGNLISNWIYRYKWK